MIRPNIYEEILLTNSLYPHNLKHIQSAPEKLYIVGKLKPSDQKAIAIIGSRKMTDYGKKVAWDFSYFLAKAGVTIVSGLARGIDSTVHKAALYAKGRTIAVLGSGIDIIYPPENRLLAKSISEQGAVVTEFPPGTPPFKSNFLARNRIISGLSLGVLIIEGARISGTLSIANWAANQGREVFVIPGRLDDPLSGLPNYLIENGAKVVTKPQEILDMLM